MCGISCVVVLDAHARHAQENRDHVSARLEKSLEQIKHRGPDSSGTWTSKDGRVGLGHARLAINDLTPSGSQPLHSNDGTVHIVVNGEIYDYPRLRAEMEEKLDYKFKGTSDCELVLALYEFYGLSFLSKIRGEFSICLYDAQRELFVAVRDRYGIKPLYWTIQDGELFVAAEVKAFLPLGWQPEWDVKNIVGTDMQISDGTIFKDVKKVRPGYIVMCRNFNNISEQQYWRTEYPDKNSKEIRTEEEMIQGVQDRLLDSIKQRLRADVKVGVSLSGGIDSSVVAGMVNQLLREGHQIGSEKENERLSCFGIAFDEDSGFDESAIANRTAEFLNVKFYKKHMNEQEFANHFEDATWHCEQTNFDLNYIGTYALSELFREHGFTVNINGQGSDEIFGGYNIFLPDFLREPDNTFQGSQADESTRNEGRAKAEAPLQAFFAGQIDMKSTTSSRRQLNNITTPQMMASVYSGLPVKDSFLPSVPPDHERTYCEYLSPIILENIQSKWHPLHSAQYIFIVAHLHNLLLSHLGDRGEMAHSIEGRTPFLDHHLTDYVNGLPPAVKIRYDPNTNSWVEKWILREASKPFITEELYQRQKHPYSAPVQFPIGGPLYKLFRSLVTVENLEELGWVDTAGVETLVDDAYEKKDRQKFKLASSLAQWVILHRRFGVKKAVPTNKGVPDGGLDGTYLTNGVNGINGTDITNGTNNR